MTSSLDSRSILYWIDGDPIFGITATGKNDPDALPPDSESRREDAAFATIAEVIPERRSLYLDSMQRLACLTARQRRDIENILASPHRSDCAAAMEAQRARREGAE
jgi:hypothetical protein